MKLMVGSTSAAVISTIWSSFPESVSAYSETKEELLSAANYIVKSLSEIDVPLQSAESTWALNRTVSQRTYDEVHRAFSSGALSGLRSTCFNLYRNHVVDAQKFKDAEAAYKEVIRSIERVNTSVLQASRDELKEDAIRGIRGQLGDSVAKLRSFIAVAS